MIVAFYYFWLLLLLLCMFPRKILAHVVIKLQCHARRRHDNLLRVIPPGEHIRSVGCVGSAPREHRKRTAVVVAAAETVGAADHATPVGMQGGRQR